MRSHGLLVLFTATSVSELLKYTVVLEGVKWTVHPGEGGVATAYYDPSYTSTGWHSLTITTNKAYSDSKQAYGAGFLEAAITTEDIWNSFRNLVNGTSYDWDPKVKQFVLDNDQWVRAQAKKPAENPQYWEQVSLVLAQLDGLFDGYNTHAPSAHNVAYQDFLAYQLRFELREIGIAVNDPPLPERPPIGLGCSCLVKFTADGKNLFTGHNTWLSFTSMLRTYKHYDFAFSSPAIKSPGVSFSGYPGLLASGDDYFVTSNGLTVTETTNALYNNSLYSKTTNHTVPYWIRAIVANRLASNGKEWSNLIALYNSGTYNNQWIIVDYKLFTPGKPLVDGTLWIAEQIPGAVYAQDQTAVLRSTGRWVSYNIPFYPEVYSLGNYEYYRKKYGDEYSYTDCPRAKLFRRLADTVTDLQSMQTLMRYNHWQQDAESLKDASNSIASRADLNPPWATSNYYPHGAIDAKIVDSELALKRRTLAVSGPTWDSQPPFAWTTQWASFPHYGHVKFFEFDWVTTAPVSA